VSCGQFKANASFFRIGVIAHNLFVLFKHSALDASWLRHQVTTVRWRLFHLPGKVVRHAGAWVLSPGCENSIAEFGVLCCAPNAANREVLHRFLESTNNALRISGRIAGQPLVKNRPLHDFREAPPNQRNISTLRDPGSMARACPRVAGQRELGQGC
jgi:hypothetical protein